MSDTKTQEREAIEAALDFVMHMFPNDGEWVGHFIAAACAPLRYNEDEQEPDYLGIGNAIAARLRTDSASPPARETVAICCMERWEPGMLIYVEPGCGACEIEVERIQRPPETVSEESAGECSNCDAARTYFENAEPPHDAHPFVRGRLDFCALCGNLEAHEAHRSAGAEDVEAGNIVDRRLLRTYADYVESLNPAIATQLRRIAARLTLPAVSPDVGEALAQILDLSDLNCPYVAYEPDRGAFDIEWVEAKGWRLSVSAYRDGSLAWAGIFGDERRKGTDMAGLLDARTQLLRASPTSESPAEEETDD